MLKLTKAYYISKHNRKDIGRRTRRRRYYTIMFSLNFRKFPHDCNTGPRLPAAQHPKCGNIMVMRYIDVNIEQNELQKKNRIKTIKNFRMFMS